MTQRDDEQLEEQRMDLRWCVACQENLSRSAWEEHAHNPDVPDDEEPERSWILNGVRSFFRFGS